MPSLLSLQNISKQFDDKPALFGVSLDIDQGEIVCLLGPSGCGKTTLLRIVAGLETADRGQVLLEGQDLSPVPPYRRDFGLMFQDFALFPHKSVFENVAFGLKHGGRGAGGQRRAGEIQNRVREMLVLVGLEGFEERPVTDLSGGEAQRVALARSLAPNPRLLMLDEPLGSLDRALRERLMNELRDILKTVGVTGLYVTHDQAEAFAIADRVVVMNQGHVEQIGPPEEIYHNPATRFVAQFLGLSNLAEGRVLGPARVDSPWGELTTTPGDYQPGDAVTILIRPEAARLHHPARGEPTAGAPNHLRGRLSQRAFRGGRYQLQVRPEAGPPLTLELTSAGPLALTPGDLVSISLDPAGIVLL